MHWLLQTTEKRLELASWIKHRLDNYETEYSVSFKGRFNLCRDYSKIIFVCKGTTLQMRTPPCICARHTVRLAACAHDKQGGVQHTQHTGSASAAGADGGSNAFTQNLWFLTHHNCS
jgi:hypothetical protein